MFATPPFPETLAWFEIMQTVQVWYGDVHVILDFRRTFWRTLWSLSTETSDWFKLLMLFYSCWKWTDFSCFIVLFVRKLCPCFNFNLYGKQLFTWLSLVVSLMASFCAVLFPTRCLGRDLGLNWVSFEGFLTYCLILWIQHILSYLWSQQMYSYYTNTGSLLGECKIMIKFWWPWPQLQGHSKT